MELERGVPTLLERPEVKHEVWLEPGMLRGEGAREERCWRIRLRFFTVWKTRFGCSLQTHKHGVDGWLLDYYKWLTSESDHTVEEKKRICTSALLRLDHPFGVPSSWCPLFLLPVSPGEETNCYLGTEDVVMQTDSLSSNYVHFFCIVTTLKFNSITHHREQAQGMETPRCAERESFISQVLQFLLSFMEHLHTLCILVLQLLQLKVKKGGRALQRRKWNALKQSVSPPAWRSFVSCLSLSYIYTVKRLIFIQFASWRDWALHAVLLWYKICF